MNKVIKEGWVTEHPTSGKRIEVVNAEYACYLEHKIEMIKMILSDIEGTSDKNTSNSTIYP